MSTYKLWEHTHIQIVISTLGCPRLQKSHACQCLPLKCQWQGINKHSFFKQFQTFPCHFCANDGLHALSPGPGSHSRSGWPATASVHTRQDLLPQTASSQVPLPPKFKSSQTWSTSLSLLLPSPSQSLSSTAISCYSGTLGFIPYSLVPSPEPCHHSKPGLLCYLPRGHVPCFSPLQLVL